MFETQHQRIYSLVQEIDAGLPPEFRFYMSQLGVGVSSPKLVISDRYGSSLIQYMYLEYWSRNIQSVLQFSPMIAEGYIAHYGTRVMTTPFKVCSEDYLELSVRLFVRELWEMHEKE